MVIFVLESMEKLSGVSLNVHKVLKSLADLFVLYSIAENSGSFLEVREDSPFRMFMEVCYIIKMM